MRQPLFICLATLLLFSCVAARPGESETKLYPIFESGKVGYIDEHGRVRIKPQFDRTSDLSIQQYAMVSELIQFSEGLAGASSKGKWGFIDASGRWVIKPQFDEISKFSEGLAQAAINGEWGFIDTTGGWVIEPQFNEVENFSEGLAEVRVNRKYGLIDKTGKMVVEPKHDWIDGMAEGLAAVDVILGDDNDGYTVRYGYIDKTGRIAIKPKFDMAYKFSEGLAPVQINGQTGYINKSGEMVIKPQFIAAERFSEGLAKADVVLSEGSSVEEMDSKHGFIDKTGQWVIKPQFDLAGEFSGGMAHVMNKIGGEWLSGYVDKTGKWIIKPRFQELGKFSEGLAAARIGDKEGYVDENGEVVIPAQFDSAGTFKDGLALVRQDETAGYINKRGEFVWQTSTWNAAVTAASQASPLVSKHTTKQSKYFPPAALGNDEFTIEWYSKHLEAMGEPSLWSASKDSKVRVYRFTWLRSFHHPVVARLGIEKDGTGILSAKVTTGMGGYEPGVLRTDKTVRLTKTQVDQFLALIAKAKFWNPPVKEKPAPKINEDGTVSEEVGLDGARWIIEGAENGKYHMEDVWSPKEGAHREAALLLITFADLKIKEIY